jgi:(2Fe-2S) ferredoxin
VLVYPEGVMYGGVSKEDVTAIIEEHLLGDKPVERLKLPDVIW